MVDRTTHHETNATGTGKWPLLALIVALAIIMLAGCSSQSEQATEAAETEAESTTTTETVAESSTAAPVGADEDDDEADAEGESEVDGTDDSDVEPNFVLDGELELTTAEINDMVAFVETSAGREFLRPPVIQVVSVEEFEAGLLPDPELEAELAVFDEPVARYQQALGHTTLGVEEYNTELDDLVSSTDLISARYDPDDDVVIMPVGVLEGDDFNAILVHELLHALDGQHVDLAGMLDELQELAFEEVASDSSFQITAVVEGRASVTQFEWMEANNVVPNAEVPEGLDRVPANVINGVILPYQLGAQSIFQLGGVAETWDLYDNFPATSEQMMFPTRIGADEPITVEAPAFEGEVFSEGVMGAQGMLLFALGDNLQPNQVEVITALTAADGWGGDYFVLSGDDAETCLTGAIVADSELDLTELSDVFTTWADRETVHGAQRSATLDGDTLTVSSCAPFVA